MTPGRGPERSGTTASSPASGTPSPAARSRTRVRRVGAGPADSPSDLEPRRRPRQERARATVDALLEAAAEVIARVGYSAMTTNKVAARAGVSIGSLYQYFPNKQAILVSLLEEHLRRVHPAVERSLDELADPAMPYAEAMRRMFERLLALHHHANPRLQRVLGEEVPHPPRVREMHRQQEAWYVERVAAILQARPDVEAERPEVTAQVLVQATSALARWLAHDAPTDLDRTVYVDEAVRLLTAHVRPLGAATPRRPSRAAATGREAHEPRDVRRARKEDPSE